MRGCPIRRYTPCAIAKTKRGRERDSVARSLLQGEVARRGWAVTTAEFARAIDRSDTAIVDIREAVEQEEQGTVPAALHVPYVTLAETLKPGGVLHRTGSAKKLIFICTFGERSAMAVQLAQALGLERARHLHGDWPNGAPELRAARTPRY